MYEIFFTECYTLMDALIWFAMGAVFISGFISANNAKKRANAKKRLNEKYGRLIYSDTDSLKYADTDKEEKK